MNTHARISTLDTVFSELGNNYYVYTVRYILVRMLRIFSENYGQILIPFLKVIYYTFAAFGIFCCNFPRVTKDITKASYFLCGVTMAAKV